MLLSHRHRLQNSKFGKTAVCDRGHSIKEADDLAVAPDLGQRGKLPGATGAAGTDTGHPAAPSLTYNAVSFGRPVRYANSPATSSTTAAVAMTTIPKSRSFLLTNGPPSSLPILTPVFAIAAPARESHARGSRASDVGPTTAI